MRNTFTKKHTGLAFACALALGVLSGTTGAQVRQDEHAVVIDSRGAPVRSGFGLCMRSGFVPAPSWTAACRGEAPGVPVTLHVAPAAAPAATPAPALAPVRVVMAAAASLSADEKVAFDANVLFDSDKSAPRPSGRDTLDQFMGEIHVDAVKAYLVGQGSAWKRVQTSARGETQPSTFAGECKEANNATNVACMQPDRHVFTAVSGTRIAK